MSLAPFPFPFPFHFPLSFNILWQLAQCRALGLPYLYLGYWIGESPKMAYKAKFQPIEGLIDGEWKALPVTA